jgi:branched-subunit amino acid aminotransferase/4-amino-4-deoxychorismate lyase
VTSLLVADSFLVAQGKVRGLGLHRARFTASCAAAGADGAGEFWDDQAGRLPGFGRWFPRFELWSEPDGARRFAVQVRPAPTPGGRVRVAVHRGPDPRTNPRVKGPDLDALGALKTEAAASTGADEVLLVDADGVAVEAAYSSLGWWEGVVL